MKVIVFLLSLFVFLSPAGRLESNGSICREVFPEELDGEAYSLQEGQYRYISVNAGQRLVTDDPALIEKWIKQIDESCGFNIVFLGDSIVYGDGTRNENQTIPSLVRKKLLETGAAQDVNVFNLTLPSAGPAEVYLITRELVKTKVDLLIYDINIGWLDRDTLLEHPVLLKLGANKELDPAVFRVFNLDEATPSYYNLYDGDDDNLRDLATPWTEKSWKGILDTEEMGKFGRFNLEWSEQWEYVKKTAALLQEYKINSLFFANPRNFEMLEQYDLIDYQSYNSNLRAIFRYLNDCGIMTLNLDKAVPSRCFSDLVHLLPEGEEIVAGRLCDYVMQAWVAAEDVKGEVPAPGKSFLQIICAQKYTVSKSNLPVNATKYILSSASPILSV